jgi:hypothetical protein
LLAVRPADAKRQQYAGSRPGIGVSGVGVPAVFVPAPGVATPTVNTRSVSSPAVIGAPGVTARNVTSPAVTGNPGVPTSGVASRNVAMPEVTTVAPATAALPQGYYTSIPPDAVQVMHRGEMVFSAKGVFYRPEYYMGSLVYVRVA